MPFVAVALAVTSLVAVGGAGTAGSASPKASSTRCTGSPLKLMSIGNRSNPASTETNDLLAGADAAADNVNATCELGRPLKILNCDTKFTPNAAAACGREAVADKVLGLVASISLLGDSFDPPVFAAGIPDVGNNSNGNLQTTNKLSFPTFFTLKDFISEITVAKSIGGKKIALVALNLPSIASLVDLGLAQAKAVGIKVLPTIEVAPTATDMSTTAAQVISSGADIVIPVLAQTQIAPLLKDLSQQGANLKKLHVIQNLQTNTPKFVRQIGQPAVGLVMTSFAWSTEDLSNPAIRQFFKEMKAAHEPTGRQQVSVDTVLAWGDVHMIADALKGSKNITSKTLVKGLNAAGNIDLNRYGLNDVNYAKPAFPTDPTLSKLRIFSDEVAAFQVNTNLVATPLSKHWISASSPSKLSLPVKP
jgi:ABC-type branched-subunit amino acid transport system substrate-binding protein